MKLSELDKMLEERRALVEMRTALRGEGACLSVGTEDWGISAEVPSLLTERAIHLLLDRSKVRLIEIDAEIAHVGVEIDMPHETEPEVFARQAGKDEDIDE